MQISTAASIRFGLVEGTPLEMKSLLSNIPIGRRWSMCCGCRLSSGSISKLVRGTSSGPQMMVGIEEDPEASRQLPPSDVLLEGFTVPQVGAAPYALCLSLRRYGCLCC